MAYSSGHWRDLANVRVLATIEARMTSTRLPGKVLAEVQREPMLQLMLNRLSRSQVLTGVCVATTTNPEDNAIARLAESAGSACFRGSEDDVLDRVLGAARGNAADVVVELTADCPLIDAAILDACVFAYFANDVHFAANCLVETFPRGLDVKVFSTDVLGEVASLTDDPADHEHVSLYIYEHPERYRLCNVPAVGGLHRPDWRWTVDTGEDLDFVRAVVYALGTSCSARDVAVFLAERPDVVAINGHVRQKPVR
jgi:spore coat polysaccharide biosynthesis protein SpsF